MSRQVRLALELVFEGLQAAAAPAGPGGLGVTAGPSAQSLKARRLLLPPFCCLLDDAPGGAPLSSCIAGRPRLPAYPPAGTR